MAGGPVIPAPDTVAAPADAELERAAQLITALLQYRQVLITSECIALWPSLGRLDLSVLAMSTHGGEVVQWNDPAHGGVMLKLVREGRR